MRPIVAVTAALIVLLAGCASRPDAPADGGPAPSADGFAPGRFSLPVAVSTDAPGAEPVIAAASDGTLFIQGTGAMDPGVRIVNRVWRSDDDGAGWTDVTPPLLGAEPSADAFIAVAADDRLYSANSAGGALTLFASDDRGDSWDLLPLPPWPAPMHRMWISTSGAATVHLIAESLSPDLSTWYLRSDDAGSSWALPVRVATLDGFGSDLAVDPTDGTLYLARLSIADSAWHLLRSTDDGRSWDSVPMLGLAGRLASSWQSLEADPSGVLSLVWAEEVAGNAQVRLATSTDGGDTWSGPVEPASSPTAQALPWSAARGPGELGVLWYAADAAGFPSEVDADWRIEYAFVRGVGTAAPAFERAVVTSDPVHRGAVCPDGPNCYYERSDRRLLDYPWAAFGSDGRARLVFASTEWGRVSAFAAYAGELAPAPPGQAAGPRPAPPLDRRSGPLLAWAAPDAVR